jgi:YVTN family beta-propeller protein
VLRFRILGPLEVLEDGRALTLRGTKQRSLLAILLLNRGSAVSADRLIDELWGAEPPATAAKALQVYVSGLRKALGREAVLTRADGYLIDVEPDQVDLDLFERLLEEGRRALEAGEAERAANLLRESLALWRGPPLADLAYEPFAQAEGPRLRELRLAAMEERMDAELARGCDAGDLPELKGVALEHPDRERLQRQLMLALYRSGRQADALEHYRRTRRWLAEELGLEPGPELRRLEQAILKQDPALRPPRRPSIAARVAAVRRLSTAGAMIAAGGLVLLAAAIAAAVISSDRGSPLDVTPNSVAVVDAVSGRLVADIPVGARPTDIAADGESIWVANSDDATASRIDPRTRRVVSTTAAGRPIEGLGAGPAGLWVTDQLRPYALRLNPEFRAVSARVRTGVGGLFSGGAGPVGVGKDAVWVGDGEESLVRIDPVVARRDARVNIGSGPTAVAIGGSGVWVAGDADLLWRIDPRSASAVTEGVPVGNGASDVAVGEGAVWVTNSKDNDVAKVDPESGSVEARIPVGTRPSGVAVGDGAVWVANSLSGTVSRIDPRTDEVVATLEVGESPQSLVVSRGLVWVSVQSKPNLMAPAQQDAEGGSVRVLLSEDPGGADPATPGDGERAYATCALLFNYPDRPAPAGSALVPELAAGQPKVSDGGRRYSFEIRRGYRFSPPSNEPVTAAAFARAFERVLNPRLQSYGAALLSDVVGAEAYSGGRARSIAGVKAVGRHLILKLTAPAPDLTARLASQYFCAVPANTPITTSSTEIIPSAGPYYVASYDPNKSLVLRRNPGYGGSRPRRPGEIVYEIGASAAAAIARVKAEQADYYSTGFENEIPRAAEMRLLASLGPGSEQAQSGHQRYFTVPALNIYYLMFNTTRPPFDDAKLRRAVNFALDRRALAREPWPGAPGRPTDQYIPPGVPGFRDAEIYPLGAPSLTRARELAGNDTRKAVLYTCSDPACARFAQIITDNLSRIGIRVETKEFPEAEFFARIKDPHAPFDLAPWPWIGDFPDPSNFVNAQFDPGITELSLFSSPELTRRMRRVARLSPPRRYSAYARLDRDLVARAAPAAAYATGVTSHLFSSRIGCQVNQPIYGIDLGLLCLRD